MSLFIPLYGSLWCLAVASDSVDPRLLSVDTLSQRVGDRRIGALRYYYPGLHQALFTLPLFVLGLTQPPSSAAGSRERTPQLRVA
jgi:spermidine synthase